MAEEDLLQLEGVIVESVPCIVSNVGIFWRVLFDDTVTAVMIAAGQGSVALVGGSVLAQLGRSLHATVLLGLLVGLFDFVMLFVQMAFPRTELGWVPDLVILAAVTLAITVLGSRAAAAPSSSASS